MQWPISETWLKNTVPGIIVLGAIGSLVAVVILKLAFVLVRKTWNALVPRFIVLNVRPFTTAALHCVRFINSGRIGHLVIYAVGLVVALNGWLVLAAILAVATAVVAIQLGFEARGLLVTLVSATGVALIMLVRQLLYVAGAAAVLFQRDLREVAKAFKDPDVVMNMANLLVKDLQAAEQAAPAAVATPAVRDAPSADGQHLTGSTGNASPDSSAPSGSAKPGAV